MDSYEAQQKLEEMGHNYETVVLQAYMDKAYEDVNLNEIGKEARETIDPNIFNTLVDQCSFESNFRPST